MSAIKDLTIKFPASAGVLLLTLFPNRAHLESRLYQGRTLLPMRPDLSRHLFLKIGRPGMQGRAHHLDARLRTSSQHQAQ
ncbi:MAG: hypothetical protein ABF562_03050 [Gluconobacter japonicus]|uniref:hypothetical protein n=1 Tax=Gluconobacter japonicus TaxID=376620 RepID=UPI0039E96261